MFPSNKTNTSSLFGNGSNNNNSAVLNSNPLASNSMQFQQQTVAKAATLDDSPFGISLSFEKIGEMPDSITNKHKSATKNSTEHLFGNGRKRQLSNASNYSNHSSFGISGGNSILNNIRNRKSYGNRSNYSKTKGLFSTSSNILMSLTPSQDDDEYGQVLLEKYSKKNFDFNHSLDDSKTKDIQYKFNDIKKLVIDPEVSAAKRRKLLTASKKSIKNIKKASGSSEKDVTILLSSTINNIQPHDQINFNNISKDETPNEEEDSVDFENSPKGYWCSPTIPKLAEMTLSSLKAVPDFVIGRKNYGQICFEKNVDLSQFAERDPKLSIKMNLYKNLLTEKEIIFHPKTVEVYTDNQNKPPRGQGLNVEAIITLENMFPKNVTRGQNFDVGKFSAKLKKQQEMQFINYIAESGSWSFRIEHFSIWGLIDDSDDEELSEETQPKKTLKLQEQKSVNGKVSPINKQPTVWGFTDNMEIDPNDIIQENTSLNIRKDEAKPNDHPQDMIIYGSNNNEDHEMTGVNDSNVINDQDIERLENSLLELDSPDLNQVDTHSSSDSDDKAVLVHEKVYEPEKLTDNDFQTLEKQPDPTILENIIDLKKNQSWDDIFDEVSNSKDSFYSLFNPELQKCLALSNSLKKKDIKKLISKKPIKEEKLSFNQLDNILFGDVNRMIQNNNDALRELRVPGKKMIFSKFCIFNEKGALYTNVKSSSFKYVKLNKKFESFENTFTLQRIFDEHYRLSTFESRNKNKLPIINASPSQEFSFLAKLFEEHKNNSFASFWELSSILFDDYKILDNNEYIEINSADYDDLQKFRMIDIARNELLSKWLLSSNDEESPQSEDSNNEDEDEKILKKVFYHLCRAEINEAAEVCISSKFNHLAIVITLLGSNDPNVKNGALHQLRYWKEKFSYSGMISPYILKIYKLLSGDFLTHTTDSINVVEGLSWKTVYLLVLQYGDLNKSLVDLTCLFFAEFIDVNPVFANLDAELSILKLYCLIYKENDNEGFDLNTARQSFMTCRGNTYPLDVLNQWYVYHILLSRLPIIDKEPSTKRQILLDFADKLTLQFAEQLIILNRWEFALFILIHLKNDALAKKYIEDLIYHKIDEIVDNDNGHIFCEKFNIPRSFIASGIALKYNYEGDYLGEAYALIEAEKYKEAYMIIIQKVAPQCVIGDGVLMDELMNLVELFPKSFKEENGSNFLLKDWSKSIGTYKTYALLKTLAESKKLDEKFSESELEVIESLINNLFVHLPMVNIEDNKDVKIAVNIMCKFIVEFIFGGVILCDKFTRKSEVEKLLRLPLDESEKRYVQQYYDI